MKFCFGDIVVVEGSYIGVIVKSWISSQKGVVHEVYIRSYGNIVEYKESDIQRYMVRHKYLDEEDLEYQANAVNGW